MANREKIEQHPLMVALTQAEAELANMPPTVAQVMPDLVERLPATLSYLRQLLQATDPNIVSDQTLANYHSWTQQIVNELQNARNNPGQPQSVQNIVPQLDAIVQNFAQLPILPGPSRLQALTEDAQRRLDNIQSLEATTQDRARSATDQINAEVAKAREAAEEGLARARENEAQANELLAQLGADGTSSNYLGTAEKEKEDCRLLALCDYRRRRHCSSRQHSSIAGCSYADSICCSRPSRRSSSRFAAYHLLRQTSC